jgi:hypothetical protein
MIRTLFFILTTMILSSCATSGRIVDISDPDAAIHGIKLTQNLSSQSASRKLSSVSMIYLLEQKKNERPTLFLDVKIETAVPSNQLDSIMIIKLDNEEITIVAKEFRPKEFSKSNSGSNQIESSQFFIPENLWVPIAYSDEIQYRFYQAEEGVDVKLTPKETSKLKEYFNRAIQLRDANLPSIPEGQKKW